MIHLDTNVLIALPDLVTGNHPLVTRLESGEQAAVCSMVWYEFRMGPVETSEIQLALAIIGGRVLPVSQADAELAAQLFNQHGRRPKAKADALIAACAINARAEFVTFNSSDFLRFADAGLRLSS